MRTGKHYWHYKTLVIVLILLLHACLRSASGGREKGVDPAPEWQQVTKRYVVTTLVYHRFGDSRYPSTNTPESAFEDHLKYLKNEGFTSYTVSGLLNDTATLAGNHKKVLITVDDGFASFLENGLPLLEKYNMKATLFVNTESVGWSDYLNWPQLKDLKAKGIEIGSHSHQHAYFVNMPENERAKNFEEDLLKAETLFNEHLGFVPKVYVYPYGEFSADMIEVLRKHECQVAFAQNSGVMSNRSHPYAIARFPVAGHHIGMQQFTSKVNMLPLEVRMSDQLPIMVEANQTISYSVISIDNKLKGPFNCFVAGTPSPDALTQKGDTLTINVKVPPDSRRTLVTITTRDNQGKWQWFSRVLIEASPQPPQGGGSSYTLGSQPFSYSRLHSFMASRLNIRPVLSSISNPAPTR